MASARWERNRARRFVENPPPFLFIKTKKKSSKKKKTGVSLLVSIQSREKEGAIGIKKKKGETRRGGRKFLIGGPVVARFGGDSCPATTFKVEVSQTTKHGKFAITIVLQGSGLVTFSANPAASAYVGEFVPSAVRCYIPRK